MAPEFQKNPCIIMIIIVTCLLSPRNALRWGYSKLTLQLWFRPSVRLCEDLVNMIETKPLHISLSNLADMLTMMRG